MMVEGLAVGLGHVVGDLDEDQHPGRRDEQGAQDGQFCPGLRHETCQKGTIERRGHRGLERRSWRRVPITRS